MGPTTRSKTKTPEIHDIDGIGRMLSALRKSSEPDAELVNIRQSIKEKRFPPYVQNLLFYALSILCKERKNPNLKSDAFNRWGIWRNFNVLDNLDIPIEACRYLQKILFLDGSVVQSSDPAWFYESVRGNYVQSLTLRNDEARLQRLIFQNEEDFTWSSAGEYGDDEDMKRELLKGAKALEELISQRLEAREDVRFLTHGELDGLHEAFPAILNAIRDPHGAFMTINVAFLLQNVWNLSYKTYRELKGPLDTSRECLEGRRNLWVEAATEAGYLDRFYTSSIRVDEQIGQIHQFITSFRTTQQAREALKTSLKRRERTRNEKKRARSSSADSGLQSSKRKRDCRYFKPDVQSKEPLDTQFSDEEEEAPTKRADSENTMSGSKGLDQPLQTLHNLSILLTQMMGCANHEQGVNSTCTKSLDALTRKIHDIVESSGPTHQWCTGRLLLHELPVNLDEATHIFKKGLLLSWVDLACLLHDPDKIKAEHLKTLIEVEDEIKKICKSEALSC